MADESTVAPDETLKPNCFQVIKPEQVTEYVTAVRDDFGIEVETVSITLTYPGDDVFDRQEIQHKLFTKCHSDWDAMLALMQERGFDPQEMSTNDFRQLAMTENIQLDGTLPGFSMVSGNDEIIFFAISDNNAIAMATKYAQKEGEVDKTFSSIDEAKTYLQTLGEKSLLHELGHIVYAKVKPENWDTLIDANEALKQKVIEVQRDKYQDESQIPVADEAFAELFPTVLSHGRIKSRIGEDAKLLSAIAELSLSKF